MDATTTVAVAGLTATTLLGIASPFLQGWIARRNARRDRSHDLAIAAYIDAMTYLHHTDVHLDRMIDPSERMPDEIPSDRINRDLISARLRLVAAPQALRAWLEFIVAEDNLWWHLREERDHEPGDEYGLPDDLFQITELRRAGAELNAALRKAAG